MIRKASFVGFIPAECSEPFLLVTPVSAMYANLNDVEIHITLLSKEEDIFHNMIKIDKPIQIQLPKIANHEAFIVSFVSQTSKLPVEQFQAFIGLNELTFIECQRYIKQEKGFLITENLLKNCYIAIINLSDKEKLTIIGDKKEKEISLASCITVYYLSERSFLYLDCAGEYVYPFCVPVSLQ
ncbi:MAG: hypothetical protein N2654_06580 [Deltaproteobacteria bacterium]|nr:hypothetical protein [Deltaproteobacteria bacterium]